MTDKYSYIFQETFLLLELFLLRMFLKICVKNFSPDECALIVDLVQENKQILFGALSSSLTIEEKNTIWGDVAQQS